MGLDRLILSRVKASGSDFKPILKDFEDMVGKLVPGKAEIDILLGLGDKI
jgi:hypothetical protein